MASHKFWEGLFDTVDIQFIRLLVTQHVVHQTDILMTVIIPRNASIKAREQLREKELRLTEYLQDRGVQIDFIHINGRTLNGLIAAFNEIAAYFKLYEKRFIWARNYFNCLIGVLIKMLQTGVFLHFDMLGLVPEEVLYYSDTFILARTIKFFALRIIERINLKTANTTSVVSRRFKQHIVNRYHLDTQAIEITPCLYHEDQFYIDEALRDKFRRECQVSMDQKLLLYSGMLQKWQEPDLVFSFMRTIQDQDKKKQFRFMMLTFDWAKANHFVNKYDLQGVIIRSANDEELNGFYNAADIGIAFRTNDMVSYVSSPVKIPEYLTTGNCVILMEYIGDFGMDLRDKKYALVKKNKIKLMNTTIDEVKALHKPDQNDLVEIQEKYSYHSNIAKLKRILDRFYAL